MAVIKWMVRHWGLMSAMFTCAMSFSIAFGTTRERISSIDDRVSWIEGTKPGATAAIANKIATDNAAILAKLDRIQQDEAANRASIQWLCGHLDVSGH